MDFSRHPPAGGSTAQLPVHPDVRFKKLPFYDVLAELLKPSSLSESPSSLSESPSSRRSSNSSVNACAVFRPGWGKGQGAKEIGHNLTIKIRAQFSARTTKNRAQFRARTPRIRARSSTRTKQDRGTILWAIDESMGTNLQALYSSSAV